MTQDRNPLPHVLKIRHQLQAQITHLREDIDKIDEPQCKALFEITAEVLIGLIKAFDDYSKKNEKAWK
ncbi:MAG: hypothetical protein HYX60_02290 [Legionella longbeachae]|nr:hypothetical protein [Legionella longbeachae]